MHRVPKLLHCLAKYYKNEGYWAAFCLDYNLYAVGDSLDEAKSKLSCQINEYIFDAIYGEDKEFGDHLLNRKAPLSSWVVYFAVSVMSHLRVLRDFMAPMILDIQPSLPPHPA